MGWNFQNCEIKQIFSLYKLIISGVNDGKLTNCRYNSCQVIQNHFLFILPSYLSIFRKLLLRFNCRTPGPVSVVSIVLSGHDFTILFIGPISGHKNDSSCLPEDSSILSFHGIFINVGHILTDN
jgi:hypothetical protein